MPNYQSHSVETNCKDCTFATLAPSSMDVQVGCALNRIYWYKKQGEVVALSDESYYRIPNRLCMAHRVKTWQQDKTIKEKIDIVYKEMAIECHVIIVVKPDTDLDTILHTIYGLQLQSHKPAYITIVIKISANPNNNINRVAIIDYLKETVGTKFKWRIQNILEDVTEDQAINMVLDIENSHQYFMIIHSGVILPRDILSQLNDHITKKILLFWYIQGNNNGDGIVCSSRIAKMYGINHRQSLFDKIDNDFKDNRTLWNKRVFQINKLIPNFPK